jgi:hypothetical protein
MLEVSSKFVATKEVEEYVQRTFSSMCRGGESGLKIGWVVECGW